MFSCKYVPLDDVTIQHNNLLETIGLSLMKILTYQRTQQMAKLPQILCRNTALEIVLMAGEGKMLRW